MLRHLLGTRVLYPGRKELPCELAPRDGSGEGLPGNILISELNLRKSVSLRKLFFFFLMSCDSCFGTSWCGEGGTNFSTPLFFSVVWCLTGCLMHMIWGGGREGEVLFLSSLFFSFFNIHFSVLCGKNSTEV